MDDLLGESKTEANTDSKFTPDSTQQTVAVVQAVTKVEKHEAEDEGEVYREAATKKDVNPSPIYKRIKADQQPLCVRNDLNPLPRFNQSNNLGKRQVRAGAMPGASMMYPGGTADILNHKLDAKAQFDLQKFIGSDEDDDEKVQPQPQPQPQQSVVQAPPVVAVKQQPYQAVPKFNEVEVLEEESEEESYDYTHT